MRYLIQYSLRSGRYKFGVITPIINGRKFSWATEVMFSPISGAKFLLIIGRGPLCWGHVINVEKMRYVLSPSSMDRMLMFTRQISLRCNLFVQLYKFQLLNPELSLLFRFYLGDSYKSTSIMIYFHKSSKFHDFGEQT